MKLIFAILMLLAWGTPALATPSFEEAVALFEDKDFKAAIEIAEPLANEGDSRAMAMMGALYQMGNGVKPDLKKAVEWFTKAAEKNHPGAQFLAGNHLRVGRAPEFHVLVVARALALGAGAMAGRKRGGLVKKKQLGVFSGRHDIAPAAAEFEQAIDPRDHPHRPFDPAGFVMQAAAVAHEAAARGQRDDIAERCDTVLSWHVFPDPRPSLARKRPPRRPAAP